MKPQAKKDFKWKRLANLFVIPMNNQLTYAIAV